MIKINSTPISVKMLNVDSPDNILEAWKISRPNAEINENTLTEVTKMDLPVNEMVHFTLQCKVPVILREIITTLREHIVWARTSRVDNLLESWDIYNRALESSDDSYIIEYKAYQVETNAKDGVPQDIYRKYLPLAYMTEFTLKISMRTLGKLLRHLKWISSQYKSLEKLSYDFTMEVSKALSNYVWKNSEFELYNNYLMNSVDNAKHINYNEFVPFEEENVISNENFMTINVKDIPIGLRAQLVRSRSLLIADNLLDSFEEQGWKSDNTITVDMTISSMKQFFLQMMSNRECWLAQRDLWSPILDLIHQYLGDQVILPCSHGKCPVFKDCIERLVGKDPGVVCPMNYVLHKDETIPMKKLNTEEIEKIQQYAVDTKRCKQLVSASKSLEKVINSYKGE